VYKVSGVPQDTFDVWGYGRKGDGLIGWRLVDSKNDRRNVILSNCISFEARATAGAGILTMSKALVS
jgi:hypothetical protein